VRVCLSLLLLPPPPPPLLPLLLLPPLCFQSDGKKKGS
jgi:hypothetical protein